MKDYYYILGVKSNSTEKEIKSAYRKLSLKFHPDKNEGDKFFEERFKEINEAYEILGDIQKRKEYDSNSQSKTENEYSYNQEPPEPEIVFFRVNKSSIKKGEILEVSWETKFANSIKILPFGVLEASGTKRFKINGDDSFQCKILASNGNKVVSKEISITVTKIQPKPTAPIILKFESDKVIADEDGFIELTWQTSNATRVEIEGLGVVPLSGSSKFNTKLKVDFNRPVSLTAHNEFSYISKSIRIYKGKVQPVPKSESNSSFLWIFIIVVFLFTLIYFNIIIKKDKYTLSQGISSELRERFIEENSAEGKLIKTIEATSEIDTTEWIILDKFDDGSSSFTEQSFSQLRNIAEILKTFPNVSIKVGSFTDNEGGASNAPKKLELSNLRASEFLKELVELGVSNSRLTSEGFGIKHPISSNDTEEGRNRNNRLSIQVVNK